MLVQATHVAAQAGEDPDPPEAPGADGPGDGDSDGPTTAAAAPARRGVHRTRALLELGTALGLGAIWYYAIDLEGNAADWDFPSIGERLTLASLRLDNNTFDINFLWHPLSGALYYAVPRSNGMPVGESMLYATAATLGWEYGLEFREKSSINDLFATPIAGLPIGEFYTQLGRYLGSTPRRGLLRGGLGWTLGLLQTAHDAMDGYVPPTPTQRDALGYDARLWHAFSASVHAGGGDAGGRGYPAVTGVQLEGEFADLPGFARAGRSRRVVAGAPRTRLMLRLEGSSAGVGALLRSDTLLLAHYTRRIVQSPQGLTGHALTVGTGLGFDYIRVPALPGMDAQRVAVTHLPGLSLQADTLSPRSRLRLRISAQPDFVGLDAPGYAQWQQSQPDVVSKSVLRKQGYYYGFGASMQARLRYQYAFVRAEASAELSAVRSKQGLDRNQEHVEIDIEIADAWLSYALWLGVTPPGAPVAWFFDLGLEGNRRDSSIGNVRTERQTTRYLARAGLQF